MNAVTDVLAAHRPRDCGFRCECGWEVPHHISSITIEHASHVAEAIEAAGLAIVELPKQTIVPTGWGNDCLGAWPVCGSDDPISAWPKRQVVTPDDQWMSPEDARSLAAGLLAAANAAEVAS